MNEFIDETVENLNTIRTELETKLGINLLENIKSHYDKIIDKYKLRIGNEIKCKAEKDWVIKNIKRIVKNYNEKSFSNAENSKTNLEEKDNNNCGSCDSKSKIYNKIDYINWKKFPTKEQDQRISH